MFDYAGCIHFHSHYSYDAHVPLPQIIDAGLRAGLDYAVLTDHFRLDAAREGWEKYHASDGHRLLLIVGEEISSRYNHYLALNLKDPIVVEKTHPQAQAAIDAVNAQGGFGFIAHPDHRGAPLVGIRSFPWIDWSVTGYSGLSLWDFMGDWASSLSSYPAILWAGLFPALALHGPKRETLTRWDALTQKDHCVAIGEIDNHGGRKRFWGISRTFFPFEFSFRTIRTHVLLDGPLTNEGNADRGTLLEALRRGSSYVSLDLWQDPRGFSFRVYDEQQETGMGGTFTRRGPALLEVKLPGPGRIRLLRDGQVVWEERARPHLQREVDLPGVYRVEVDQRTWGRWRPWIFSNPIWIR